MDFILEKSYTKMHTVLSELGLNYYQVALDYRERHIRDIGHCIAYQLRTVDGLTLKQTGDLMNKDHTSIMNSLIKADVFSSQKLPLFKEVERFFNQTPIVLSVHERNQYLFAKEMNKLAPKTITAYRHAIKRIYIAGKITGLHQSKYISNFLNAKNRIQKLFPKANVLSPVELVPANMNYTEQIQKCLELIARSEAIYFMPNFIHSAGCQQELKFAYENAKIIYYELQ